MNPWGRIHEELCLWVLVAGAVCGVVRGGVGRGGVRGRGGVAWWWRCSRGAARRGNSGNSGRLGPCPARGFTGGCAEPRSDKILLIGQGYCPIYWE